MPLQRELLTTHLLQEMNAEIVFHLISSTLKLLRILTLLIFCRLAHFRFSEEMEATGLHSLNFSLSLQTQRTPSILPSFSIRGCAFILQVKARSMSWMGILPTQDLLLKFSCTASNMSNLFFTASAWVSVKAVFKSFGSINISALTPSYDSIQISCLWSPFFLLSFSHF